MRKIFLFSLICFLLFCVSNAQAQMDEDYGFTRVNLEGGHSFLLPDSYIHSTSGFVKNFAAMGWSCYENYRYGTAAVFVAKKLADTEDESSLKEAGLEYMFENKLSAAVPGSKIQLSRIIKINDRDVLFARGNDKFGNAMIMYMLICDGYIYCSAYYTQPSNFNTMYGQFLEIQNSFK